MIQKLSDYIADFLVDNGIDTVFGVTGGGAMHLNDSLGHKEGLNFVFNHNEQGSSVAAEGYTRLTGRLAAINVTSGPGGTNAITGVLGGWLDSIPMFIISGQVKRETTVVPYDLPLRQLGDQEYQIIKSVDNMTKYAEIIWEPEDVAYHLEKALFLATNGRGGPVWLDIPLDVQGARVDADTLIHFDKADEIGNVEFFRNLFGPLNLETSDIIKFVAIANIDKLSTDNPSLLNEIVGEQNTDSVIQSAYRVISEMVVYNYYNYYATGSTEGFLRVSDAIFDPAMKQKVIEIENRVDEIAISSQNQDIEYMNTQITSLLDMLNPANKENTKLCMLNMSIISTKAESTISLIRSTLPPSFS